jgi:hypothetical protein
VQVQELREQQQQQQQAAASSALYGTYTGTISSSSFTAPLPVASPKWTAAAPSLSATNHFASAAAAPAAVNEDSTSSPVASNALQTYIALHQQQQLGHQLCMQSVLLSRKQHGGLSAAAQMKLAELMTVQQVQMRLQEELLLSLMPCGIDSC